MDWMAGTRNLTRLLHEDTEDDRDMENLENPTSIALGDREGGGVE
jgi:hypothetical protein